MSKFKLYVGDFSTWSPIITQIEVDEKLKKKVSTINGIEPDLMGNIELNLPDASDIRINSEATMELYPTGTTEFPITIPNFDAEKNALLLFNNTTKIPETLYRVVEDGDSFKVVLNEALRSNTNINAVSISGTGISGLDSSTRWSEF